jgi:hypothetical protein
MAKYIGTMSDGRIINLKSVDDKIVRIVQNDKDTTIIDFEITKDKSLEGVSNSQLNISIHYDNIDRDTGDRVTDIYTMSEWSGDPNTIEFSWIVGSNASVYAGKCHFQVVITVVDESGVITKQWSSTICSIEVVRSLEDVNITQPKSFIDYITQVKKSVSDRNTKIATAITEKGVATEPTDSADVMASNIGKIQTGTSNSQILSTTMIAGVVQCRVTHEIDNTLD